MSRRPPSLTSFPTTWPLSSSSSSTCAVAKSTLGAATTARLPGACGALDRFLGEHAIRWLPVRGVGEEAATAELYQALADLLSTHLCAEFGAVCRRASPTS